MKALDTISVPTENDPISFTADDRHMLEVIHFRVCYPWWLRALRKLLRLQTPPLPAVPAEPLAQTPYNMGTQDRLRVLYRKLGRPHWLVRLWQTSRSPRKLRSILNWLKGGSKIIAAQKATAVTTVALLTTTATAVVVTTNVVEFGDKGRSSASVAAIRPQEDKPVETQIPQPALVQPDAMPMVEEPVEEPEQPVPESPPEQPEQPAAVRSEPPVSAQPTRQPAPKNAVEKQAEPTPASRPEPPVEAQPEPAPVEPVVTPPVEPQVSPPKVSAGSSEALGALDKLDIDADRKLVTPPPSQSHSAAAAMISARTLESRRISGDRNIPPDKRTRFEIERDGKDRLTAGLKVCISTSGAVTSAHIVHSSGYKDYDVKVARAVEQSRYRPYTVAGNPVPACANVSFEYKHK